eukprot:scaffold206120_cov27-Tisochrysis_lutea.AAC.2
MHRERLWVASACRAVLADHALKMPFTGGKGERGGDLEARGGGLSEDSWHARAACRVHRRRESCDESERCG